MTASAAAVSDQRRAYLEQLKAAFPPLRRARITAELKIAFNQMSAADLRTWSTGTADVLVKAVWRRLRTLGGSLKRLGA